MSILFSTIPFGKRESEFAPPLIFDPMAAKSHAKTPILRRSHFLGSPFFPKNSFQFATLKAFGAGALIFSRAIRPAKNREIFRILYLSSCQ